MKHLASKSGPFKSRATNHTAIRCYKLLESTLPETDRHSHLKMDGWKTSFFSGSLSSGAMLVSGNVSHIKLEHSPFVDL